MCCLRGQLSVQFCASGPPACEVTSVGTAVQTPGAVPYGNEKPAHSVLETHGIAIRLDGGRLLRSASPPLREPRARPLFQAVKNCSCQTGRD
jgi:hypothetical protein